MRKCGIAACVLFVALATSPGHAQKGVSVFTATLAGENEVPLVSSPAAGTFKAEIDESTTPPEVRYELSYSGFTTEVRQSHIHIAQPFASGAIMVWLCQTKANPAPAPVINDVPQCVQDGTVTGVIRPASVSSNNSSSGQGVGPGEYDEFVAAIRSGNAYANVHSVQSGAGEIRGQLKPGNGPK